MRLIMLVILLSSALMAQDDEKHDKQSKYPIDENTPVGPTNQPEWTTWMRFPTTRVYLQVLPDEMALEQWITIRNEKGNVPTDTRFKTEISTGLGSRCEFDFYFEAQHVGSNQGEPAQNGIRDISIEFKHAIADWGQIPLNPTLYLEYFWLGEPKIQPKLLLADNLSPEWRFATNLIYGAGVGVSPFDRDSEYQISAGISRTVTNAKFAVGVEAQYIKETNRDRNFPTKHLDEVMIGPSLQFRIGKKMMLDFTPMFGLTSDSRKMDIWLVYKWEVM